MKLSQIARILDLSDCTCPRIFLNITAVIQWRIRYILAAKSLPVVGTTTGTRTARLQRDKGRWSERLRGCQ